MTKLLIIEDDEAVVEFLKAWLGEHGYEVDAAVDGLAGLVKLRSGHPDVVILDVMMPDVDGVRVLAQMLEEGNGSLPLPVIVITGSPEGADECRRLIDPDDVLEKPFDPEVLLERIRANLGREH